MKVDTIDGNAWSAGATQRQPEQILQDVFSQILLEASHEGDASDEPVSEDVPLADQISDSWSSWFNGIYEGEQEDAEGLEQTYGDILIRAYQESGYCNPELFFKMPSQEELSTVQHLDNFIQVDNLSIKEDTNPLILPPGQVNMNHDGLTHFGEAYGMRFPDSDTPPEVAKAWETAIDGMDPKERIIHEIQMILPILTANTICDENGEYVKIYQPGDPEFENPMASQDYSYVQYAEERLAYTENFRNQMTPERYELDKSFWTNFHNLLTEYGAS